MTPDPPTDVERADAVARFYAPVDPAAVCASQIGRAWGPISLRFDHRLCARWTAPLMSSDTES